MTGNYPFGNFITRRKKGDVMSEERRRGDERRRELKALCQAIVKASENDFDKSHCQLLLAYAYSYFPELRRENN